MRTKIGEIPFFFALLASPNKILDYPRIFLTVCAIFIYVLSLFLSLKGERIAMGSFIVWDNVSVKLYIIK